MIHSRLQRHGEKSSERERTKARDGGGKKEREREGGGGTERGREGGREKREAEEGGREGGEREERGGEDRLELIAQAHTRERYYKITRCQS